MRRRLVRGITLATAGSALLLAAASLARAEEKVKVDPVVEDAKVELGRRLFFDPAASRLGRHPCADCHLADHGFAAPRLRSEDDFGPTDRHSQSLVDVAGTGSGHWDGQFRDVR